MFHDQQPRHSAHKVSLDPSELRPYLAVPVQAEISDNACFGLQPSQVQACFANKDTLLETYMYLLVHCLADFVGRSGSLVWMFGFVPVAPHGEDLAIPETSRLTL